jgi:hypothetical protein
MNLHLETLDHRGSYRPGDVVEGVAGWEAADGKPPAGVEVRLFWHTTGKGDEDVGIADTARFENPAAADAQRYMLQLPVVPYSFSGRLISLQWSLELIVQPGNHVTRLDITVSPTGEEVRL